MIALSSIKKNLKSITKTEKRLIKEDKLTGDDYCHHLINRNRILIKDRMFLIGISVMI